MPAIRPRRSALYMPASNPRAIEKARLIDADIIIIDLEDAVAPEMKELARQAAVKAIADGGFGHRELVIRTNAPEGPWFDADLAAASLSGCDALLIPKVSRPETLRMIGARLSAAGAPAHTKVWAMIETAFAVLRAGELASCALEPATRLTCFVIGSNDLAKETRARIVPGRAPMLPWLATAIAAARAYGLDILDGVYNDFKDLDALRAEAEQGRDMGFDGKTLSHPSQTGIVNEIFSPSTDELKKAREIIDAFALPENASKGAIALNGWMVERLHAEMAERVVALDAAIRARG
ncbi:MAG: HpcH/HpaI aldolase/citrate lyase family protein [Bosea sp. (in: a-proteobacteria)]